MTDVEIIYLLIYGAGAYEVASNGRSVVERWRQEYGNDANAEFGIKGPEKGVARDTILCIVTCIAFGTVII